MKRNHDEPAAGNNPAGGDVGQEFLQLFEFFIDGDPQRLEDARGRMCSTAAAGRRLFDQGGEFLGGGDGMSCPVLNDGVGDSMGVLVFAEVTDDVRKPLHTGRPQKFTGGLAVTRVEPQIKRTADFEPEAAFAIDQLIG